MLDYIRHDIEEDTNAEVRGPRKHKDAVCIDAIADITEGKERVSGYCNASEITSV